ncbi:MAG TPA: PTS lactose transporter subunit IIC, partial [Clostridiales bacterium]|nr:PTS lactose transporter subunit IIC [Clostridiales bacterium]
MNFNKISDILSEFNRKLENMQLMISVRNGLTYMIPIILMGSVTLLLLSLPIPAYQSMMEKVFGVEWKNFFMYVQDGTFNILSLLMVVCVSYSFAVESNERNRHISPIIVSAVSLCSFIAISGISSAEFSIAKFGAVGIFTAMLTSIISSVIFLKLSSIDFFRIKVFTDGAEIGRA